jgi:stearoyl-CoA desaturase (delta-9 desaturase)
MTAQPIDRTAAIDPDLASQLPEEDADSLAALQPDQIERGIWSADRASIKDHLLVGSFVAIPLIALLAAIPLCFMFTNFVSWLDIAMLVVFYFVAVHGITIGFHRYFTHRAFKANRPTKIALAIAGSIAIEGPVIRWVADHRKHHKYSDKEQDPHSPWKYGDSAWGLTKGLVWAHIGWMFDPEQTPTATYAPDLIRDKDIVKISRNFFLITVISMAIPPIVGGLVTWSWWGAFTAFFWATLVRIALVHHVTWSVNSVCHVWGKHPFKSRDKAGNVAWLALISGGESWHNLHHADPTAARQGVLKGQIDTSARIIRWMEKAGWVTDVRWLTPERIESRRVSTADSAVDLSA